MRVHCLDEPVYRDTGVVLRTYKLRGTDQIVAFHTAEHGKVRAVAKGVRKMKLESSAPAAN